MKKLAMFLAMALVLSGCAAHETFETVADELIQSVMAQPKEIWVSIPEDSAMPAMESENGCVYICKDYEVAVQTLESGDLNATVQLVSGFDRDRLTILKTDQDSLDRYDFVWTCAGENQQLGRGAILDDGNYHYVISSTIDAGLMEEYQEIWNGIFESFTLS